MAAASAQTKQTALEALNNVSDAASNPLGSHTNTGREVHAQGHGPEVGWLPLTVGKFHPVAAMLNYGRRRSWSNYISKAQLEYLRAGHRWPDDHALCCHDCKRRVLCGIGPARQYTPSTG